MKTYENLRGKRVDVRERQVRANKILLPPLWLARLSLRLSPLPFFALSSFRRFVRALARRLSHGSTPLPFFFLLLSLFFPFFAHIAEETKRQRTKGKNEKRWKFLLANCFLAGEKLSREKRKNWDNWNEFFRTIFPKKKKKQKKRNKFELAERRKTR